MPPTGGFPLLCSFASLPMSFNYDELFSRYTSFAPDGTTEDLIWLLEGDFDNWQDSYPEGADHATAVYGLLSHDEAIWMYSQLKQG